MEDEEGRYDRDVSNGPEKSTSDGPSCIESLIQPPTFLKTQRTDDRFFAAEIAPSVTLAGGSGAMCYRPFELNRAPTFGLVLGKELH